MIATDFLYHLSCKTTYLNRSIPKLAPHTPYDDAFSQLAYKVSNEILEHGTGCYLTQLHDRYLELLVGMGVADATFSKTSMKKRIKDPQKGKHSLVCARGGGGGGGGGGGALRYRGGPHLCYILRGRRGLFL